MISYGGLASAGSHILQQRYIAPRSALKEKTAIVATGSRGYLDRSNCYKGLVKHCVRYNTQSSFYRVTEIEDRWFFVHR